MATTTNYGWTTPDNTGLVKDGASNIRTLGSSVDTTLFSALNGRSAGQVLLNATTISASASTVISNVFTSTYANYAIVFRLATTANTSPIFRFATSGTGNSTTNHRTTGFFQQPSQTSYNGLYDNMGIVGSSVGANATYSGSINAFSPQASTPTFYNGFAVGTLASTTGILFNAGGAFEPSTVFDGFSITCGSGTISGIVRIYGLKDA